MIRLAHRARTRTALVCAVLGAPVGSGFVEIAVTTWAALTMTSAAQRRGWPPGDAYFLLGWSATKNTSADAPLMYALC